MANKNGLPPAALAAMLAVIALAALAFSTEKPRSHNPRAQALIDKVWAGRDQDWEAKRLDQQISDLEEAERLDPQNPGIKSFLSRLYFERGMTEEEKKGPGYREKARQYFERGYEAARKALSLKETSLGHYLAAINKGAAVAGAGIVEQVRCFREVKNHMDWIGKHDPNYHYGAYARFWLDCYENAPDPVIAVAGISKAEACQWLDDAIRREPRYLENHYYKVNSCIDPDDEKSYLTALDAALKIDPNSLSTERSTNDYFHGKLREMWKVKTGKEHP